jgi:hypothetical protein
MEGATDEKAGGRDRPQAPGIVIVIEARDGRQQRVIGPPPPVIEHVQEAGISDEV